MTAIFPTVHPSGAPFGSLHPNHCKEQISIAYAHAVVTAARCKLDHIKIDNNSVDAVVMQEAEHELLDGVELDIQLKCTAQRDRVRDDHVAWPLEQTNHNQLASERRYNKAILVVMVVPERVEEWVTQSEDSLQLVRCAYWVGMTGQPLTDNQSKTVRLPKSNVFNVEQLLGILQRVADGGRP
ncbi:DUF4365 domain-containing protein [Lentzea sp. NPDC051208]|uniref:DUF4365 domain-containing protein n=1 Tax=Lentzea sp. NPDC051208 TaxID=3154642 RepID=UPI003432CBC5